LIRGVSWHAFFAASNSIAARSGIGSAPARVGQKSSGLTLVPNVSSDFYPAPKILKRIFAGSTRRIANIPALGEQPCADPQALHSLHEGGRID
jgi:hypothetical protein